MKTVNPMQAHKFTKNQINKNSLNNTKNEKYDKDNNYLEITAIPTTKSASLHE